MTMPGISITFEHAWIGLATDPSNQIAIPRLTGTQTGDATFALVARYGDDERDSLDALAHMLESAQDATDSRLLLRTDVGQVPGLDGSVLVEVSDVHRGDAGDGLEVGFTAHVSEVLS